MSDPVQARRELSRILGSAHEWRCECGETADVVSANWRWNGTDWEHYHGYPMGHVLAKRQSDNGTG